MALLQLLLYHTFAEAVSRAVITIWSSTWGQLCYKLAMHAARNTHHSADSSRSECTLWLHSPAFEIKSTLSTMTLIPTLCVRLLFAVSIFRLSPVVRLEHWPSCLALLCLPWLHLDPSLPATWTGIRAHKTNSEACSALIHQNETRGGTWTEDKSNWAIKLPIYIKR